MRYESVAECYRDLEAASARLELIDRLAELFRETPTELLPTLLDGGGRRICSRSSAT